MTHPYLPENPYLTKSLMIPNSQADHVLLVTQLITAEGHHHPDFPPLAGLCLP